MAVTIVTYNSRRYIGACLDAFSSRRGAPSRWWWWIMPPRIVRARSWPDSPAGSACFYNDQNVGFAAAQNQAIAAPRAIGFWP